MNPIMSNTHTILYENQSIDFELYRSKRKTLAIHIYPDAHVEVRASEATSLDEIYKIVLKRAKWIRTKQAYFEQLCLKHQPRKYVSGEDLWYLGERLKLKIKLDIICRVEIAGEHLLVLSHHPNDKKLTEQLITDWFRARALEKFNERLEYCIKKFSTPKKFTPSNLTIKQLSSRWGSMASSKRITLNLKLIHMPIPCIDYVIIHELCHIKHMNHSPKFYKMLEEILPDWESLKQKLNEMRAVT
ncbi:metal-dependent hydrolase [Alphaproteobacteria bacterium]|nr:metal-dependent hydrolase [Alphaproteobacteria bacterium]